MDLFAAQIYGIITKVSSVLEFKPCRSIVRLGLITIWLLHSRSIILAPKQAIMWNLKKKHNNFVTIWVIWLTALTTVVSTLQAQSIGIGTTTPDPSAALDIASANQGLLIPRIGLSALNSPTPISGTPAIGLMVFNDGSGGLNPRGLYWWNGSQWRYVIDSLATAGVLIGQGTPTSPIMLQAGNAAGDMLLWNGTQWVIQPAPFDSVCATAQNHFLQKWTGTRLCNSLVYDDGNKVGIGTTTPLTRLHVYDTASTATLAISAKYRSWLILHQISTGAGYAMGIETSSGDTLLQINYDRPAGTAYQNIITARKNGFVGLRIPYPQAPLHLTNAGGSLGEFLRVENPQLGKVLFILFDDTIGAIGNPDGVVYFEITGNETYMTGGHLISDDDGTRLLGNSIHRWQEAWAVNGDLQTSSRDEKHNIQPVGYGLQTVLALRPVRYQWRHFPDTAIHLGFVAEEVARVIPEVVRYGQGADSTQIKGMAYSELIPVLTQAIQELYQEVQRLQREVEQLRRQQNAGQ